MFHEEGPPFLASKPIPGEIERMDEKTPEGTGRKPSRVTVNIVAGLFLLGLSIYVIIHSYVALPLGTHFNPGPGYMPMLLGIVLAVLALAILAQSRRSPVFRTLDWPGFKHSVGIVGCCIFAVPALERLGYRITMFLILVFLFGVLERLKVWLTVVLSAGLCLGSYWLFHYLLAVPLPIGVFGF